MVDKLDEDDELLTASDYVQLPGEGIRSEQLPDSELVQLVSADDPHLIDPAEADEPEPVRPDISYLNVRDMLGKIEEFMQWSSVVDDSDLHSLKALRAKLHRKNIIGKKQIVLPFTVVPRP